MDRGIGVWIGVDWSDSSHEVCVVDDQGVRVRRFEVANSAEGLESLVVEIRSCGTVRGVAIESTRHLVVAKLIQAGFPTYLVNPKMTKAWRDGWRVAGAKDDKFDAWVHAEGLRHHHAQLRRLAPDDEATRRLTFLVEDEMRLIDMRTALVNQLQATLKIYYPVALEWFSDWTAPTAADFILRFSTPEKLRSASARTIYGFLKKHHIGFSMPIWQKRVENRAQKSPWPSDAATIDAKSELAISLAKMLRTLNATLNTYRTKVEPLFANHPDAGIFSSLPGAGPKLAPRLLACFGANRDRFDSASALQQLSGTVPVTESSGKKRDPKVSCRWACQKRFRTTMHLYAFQSTLRCSWAAACYEAAKSRGKDHAHALRIVAAKWLKIIFRMWQDRVPYDDARHSAALAARYSPIPTHLATAQQAGTG